VTLPGEGKDRVFRVTIKWVAQVSLFALEEALEGRTRQIPYDAILVSLLYRCSCSVLHVILWWLLGYIGQILS
jgi:hypothetical protein